MSAPSFMSAHRVFGEVEASLYGHRITVAASAQDGKPRIAVHGRTKEGLTIGGLFSAEGVRTLIGGLRDALEYAEAIAAEQKRAQSTASGSL